MTCPTYKGGFDFSWYFRYHDEALYEGPLEFNTYVPVDTTVSPRPDFCTLTWNKDQVYILVDVLVSFLSTDTLRNLWVVFKDSGGVPFFVWDVDGDQYKKKTSMWIDPSGAAYRNDQNKWVTDQLARWKDVVKATLSGIPGSFYGRLMNPFKSSYLAPSDVIFTPRPAKNSKDLEVDEDDLQTIFTPILKKIKGGKDNIMSYSEAAKKDGFRCIGSDLFGFYCTWVKSASYKSMWEKMSITQLGRDWPDADKAVAANDLLKTDPIKKSNAVNDILSVRISMEKIIATFDVQKRDPDQQTVMGKSATEVFEEFWSGESSQQKAEWLHRSAFHFGGLEKGFNPQSSQCWKNLIFGTKEANTDMIRAENAIDQYLSRYSRMVGDSVSNDKIYGTLKTVNNRTTAVSRRKVDGSMEAPKKIENWVRDKKYRWLSFNLEYSWSMTPPVGQKRRHSVRNLPFIGSTKFDPLSQYRPMQIEGQLDTALLSFLFGEPTTTTAGPSTSSSANVSPSTPSLRAFQQPRSALRASTNQDSDSYSSTTKSISLFGNSDLSASLVTYTIKNPQTAADKAKVAQVATFSDSGKSLTLASVFPALKGTSFDSISFTNSTFLYQNFEYDGTKEIGWHFSSTWAIDSTCGTLKSVLKDVLGVDKTSLSVYAALGTKAGWDRSLDAQSFAVEGVFAGLKYSPPSLSWIHVTSIGARLFGVRMFELYPTPSTMFKYGFSVFGTVNLDVPGSVTPAECYYDMTEFDGSVSFSADVSGSIWRNALGVQGLTLHNVTFSTDFVLTSPWKSVTFDISAAFLFRYSTFCLRGSFVSKSDFSLSATLTNFNLTTIRDLYEHITKNKLVLPDVDVSIKSATITISSAKSLNITLQDVHVNEHTAASASLIISTSGVVLRGELTSSSISFGEIQLKKAYLQVQFVNATSTEKTDVGFGGEIEFSGLIFDAAVHLYRDTGGVQWTVFAALTADNGTLEFKKFLPAVSGTCLENVALRQVVFVAASKDDPYLGGNIVPSGYTIHQGVQIWATIVTIDAIHDMARQDVGGLILGAGWSKASGFMFDVIIPSPIQFSVEAGVRTEPIKIEIHTNPVQLVISAGLSVKVPYSDWLKFSLMFKAGITDATIGAEMEGTWKNPMGISSEVSISNVGLQVYIIYEQFFATGTPSGFAIKGSLALGQTNVSIALSVAEDPTKELLSAQASNLSLTDLVTFARKVTGLAIPYPPDILAFRSLDIYICPSGCWVGSKWYPQGFAFSATGTLYSNDFDISCSVGSSDVSLHGYTSRFYLWAVTLKNSSLDCTVGSSRQYISVAGTVTVDLWLTTVDVSASFYIQLYPSFDISFHCSISFSLAKADNTQSVKLTGKPTRTVSHNSAPEAEVLLSGVFDNGLLEHLYQQVRRLFNTARRFEQLGVATLRLELDQEKQRWERGISQSRATIGHARDVWQRSRDNVIANAEMFIAQYDSQLVVLQAAHNEARRNYYGALDNARTAVQAAQYQRIVRLRDAQYGVDAAKLTMRQHMQDAVRAEEAALRGMFRLYGDAPHDLERARHRARALRDQHDDLERDLRGFTREYPVASHPWTGTRAAQLNNELSTASFRRDLASHIVSEAESTIASDAYIRMQGIVDNARQLVHQTEERGTIDQDNATMGLRDVEDETETAIDNAERFLKQVETGEAHEVLQKTITALKEFRQANIARYNSAHEDIRDVDKLPEREQYKQAQAHLATIYGELQDLEVVDSALQMFQDMNSAELGLGEWVNTRSGPAFSIGSVKLEGSMSEFFGAGGAKPMPLKAVVKGTVMGITHTVETQWSPDTAADFTMDVFKSFWRELGRARARG